MKLSKMIKCIEEELVDTKPSTVKAYCYSFKRIYKLVDDIEDMEQILKAVSQIPESSRFCVFSGFIKAYATMYEIPEEFTSKLKDLGEQDRKRRNFQQKENKQNFKMDDLKEAFRKCSKDDVIDRWVLGSYAIIPPLRPQEYITSKIYKKDKPEYQNQNRLIIESKKLIIVDHKTKSKYGTKEIHLPDEYMEVIHSVFEYYKPRYFFSPMTKPKERAGRNKVLNFFKKNFNVSVTDLRNFFVSETIDNPTIKPKEREILARVMGHSVSIANSQYSKYSTLTHSKDIKEIMKAMLRNCKESKTEKLKILNSLMKDILEE